MYWKLQEEIVFGIVFLVVLILQTTLIAVVWNAGYFHPVPVLVLLGSYFLLLVGLVKYAKWVWKTKSTWEAAKIIVKYGATMVAVISFLILLSLLTKNML